VVQLRLFKVSHAGTPAATEQEMSYSDFNALGFVCQLDLFPACADQDTDDDKSNQPTTSPLTMAPLVSTSFQRHLAFAEPIDNGEHVLPVMDQDTSYAFSFQTRPRYTQAPLTGPRIQSTSAYHPAFPSSLSIPASVPLPMHIPPSSHMSSPSSSLSRGQYNSSLPSTYGTSPDVIACVGDFPLTESSKCTEALSGTTFVASSCLDYQSKPALMFIFSDLAVKTEGTYFLRYRVFDILARAAGDREHPALAECYGGLFRVYSTKAFPGLRASTDLTKHISYRGVRLNSREHERKRRKTNQANQARRGQNVHIAPASTSSLEYRPRSMSSTSTFSDLGSGSGYGGEGRRTKTSGKL